MLAFSIGTASDSLAVYSIAGERLWAHAFGEIHGLDWCGESLLVTAAAPPEHQIYLFRIDLSAGEVSPIAPMVIGRALSCSPDGAAAIQIDVVDGQAAFILRDLTTGEVYPFPDWDVANNSPIWIPDEVTPVPVGVRAADDTIRMERGEKRRLAATLVPDVRPEGLEGTWWESLDPDVANFNPDQELAGNQAGVARVLARWRHSLQDTIVVVVEDNGHGGPAAVLTERWTALDTTRWILLGSHHPVVRAVDGGHALQLRGDEKYADGVVLREAVPLDQGVTIEYEFKMELTRDVHQNVSLCLRDLDPARIDAEKGLYSEVGEVLCFMYPSREFRKLDPSDISFRVTPGVETRVRVPTALPTAGWTHIAIQVRADGGCSLVVNRQRVATSPILLPTNPRVQWTVAVDGDAVGTELLVRNLNIWREVRY
jgi:hypothetical protein